MREGREFTLKTNKDAFCKSVLGMQNPALKSGDTEGRSH